MKVRLKFADLSGEQSGILESPEYNRVWIDGEAILADDVIIAMRRGKRWMPTSAITSRGRDYSDVLIGPA